jgi:CO/xanthine dehydrogenase Mo-binding subunit
MAEDLWTPWQWKVPSNGIIGKGGIVAPDAIAKITGKAAYTKDITLPNMCYAKFFLSPYAHAKIKNMDTTKAAAVDGVVDILRYDDPTIQWETGSLPPAANNQPSVLPDEAHYFGQPVGAVIVATSEYACDEALKLIEIEWEEKDVIIDWNAAMESNATLLRPDLNDKNNLRQEGVNEHGNVEEGFKNCDNIVEFTVNIGENACAAAEGMTEVVDFDASGNVAIWFHGQGFNTAEEIAGEFTSQSKIDLHSMYNGGTFGGPISHGIEGWALWPALVASKRLLRPVKMLWDEAQFLGADEAVGKIDFKIGYNNDGTIVAVSLETNWTGQLIHGDIAKLWASSKIPNLYHHYTVPYLNRIIPGVFRDGGLGSTCMNIVFSRVAAELGMDPTEVLFSTR